MRTGSIDALQTSVNTLHHPDDGSLVAALETE